VTNFSAGKVEVYDRGFHLLRRFRDSAIPVSYRPFGIAVLSGNIYVTYAKTAPGGHDDLPGPGHGFVDQVGISGNVLLRVATQGALNSPWGMAIAPGKFGRFAGKLLVGNFGNGAINVYDQTTGTHIGQVSVSTGPLRIPGLWSLAVGNDALAGSSGSLFFTAGPNGETQGLFGVIK
jgi:uncharacterized protein (TIGR03118 family)